MTLDNKKYVERYGYLCEIIGQTSCGDYYIVVGFKVLSIIKKWTLDGDTATFTRDSFPSGYEVHNLSDYPFLSKNKYGSLTDMCDFFENKNKRPSCVNPLDLWLQENVPGALNCLNKSTVLLMFQPFASTLTFGSISLTRTAKDKKANRQTSMKFGRALLYMFPYLTNEQIERLVTKYRTEMAPRSFTLKTGTTREDFKRAYTHTRCSYQNPKTTCQRKSLASSCLHEKLTGDGTSPAEVYASGEFTIAWLEDSLGHIGGRVVIRDKGADANPHAAPVYGACDVSLTLLQDYLSSIDAVSDTDGWIGAKLLHLVDSRYDRIIGPYIDGDLSADLVHCGSVNCLVLKGCSEGEYEFTDTDGYLEESNSCYCERCSDRMNAHDAYFNDDGVSHCGSCFHEYYVHTDNGPIPIDEAVMVTYKSRFNPNTREEWAHMDDAVYCECVDQYWYPSDVTDTEDGEFVPTHLVGDYPELFPSDEEDEEEEEQVA